ncbi:MFS transporter [Actinomadura barringtoniae]|uniref:MFS transporter n=1 Tax=Actinomadura barringtoniae TaxID=1427535 RepID=A0A939PIG4_9ACTN|nr:MFS transporter [Actinomadura barringtoniae]MBO2450419.1 MFS transporter [Actinomadura barringtoniae]
MAAREVIGLTGPAFPLISFAARLPAAMCPIGSLLLVNERSGSISAAGLVGGALALGQAVGGPLIGRSADRYGQRFVVLAAALVNAAMIVSVVLSNVVPLQAVFALLAGLSVPQIGPLARSRLIALTSRRRPALTGSALSLDGAIDETSFVTGPALVGILAAAVDPAAGLLTAAAVVASFGTLFAFHPSSGQVESRPEQESRSRVLSLPLVLLCLGMFLQGTVFGSIQTGVTDLTEKLGHAGSAGLIYGLMGLPSALVGLAMTALPPARSLRIRLRLVTAAQFVLTLPLLAVDSILGLTVAVCVLGLTFAPNIITTFGLTERAAPPERMSEAMAYLGSGIILGTSTGAAVSGQLADRSGYTASFALACAAAAISAVIALAHRRSAAPAAVTCLTPDTASSK